MPWPTMSMTRRQMVIESLLRFVIAGTRAARSLLMRLSPDDQAAILSETRHFSRTVFGCIDSEFGVLHL